ncbi:MAG: LTA synthase family protein, partial [Paramuribaculum sp.]|nr:LTA synthase family protein [Paramuribaculum sp.]
VYSMKYPSVTYPSLNKAMRERYGAKSYIFTCDKPITWNQQAISRAFGYDSLIDRRAWRMDEMIGNPAKLSDGSFLRQSVELLRQGHIWPEGESRMLTFVTYSGHNPFRLPDKMVDPQFDMRDKDLPRRLADYIAMAHYTDSQLHTLMDYLRARSDFDETLVVIVGDHEGLAGDRNDFAEACPLVSDGQYTPLLILNAPGGSGSRVESVAGQIDIYPTLTAMLGLSDYCWHGMGQSLLDTDRAAYAISMMTGEEVGDTAAITPQMLQMLRSARRISDAAIRSDYFKNRILP